MSMNGHFCGLLAAGCAAWGGSAYAAVVDIDFEGLPANIISSTLPGDHIPAPSTVLTDQFRSDGVLFGRTGVSAGVAILLGAASPSSGNNSVAGLDENGLIPGSILGSFIGGTYFSFVVPGTATPGATNWISFTIGDNGEDIDLFDISAFASDDSAVYNQSFAHESRFPVTIAVTGIHRVAIDFRGDFGYTLDDLVFNTPVPVPVPAGLPLFGTAVAGLGLIVWRDRKTG